MKNALEHRIKAAAVCWIGLCIVLAGGTPTFAAEPDAATVAKRKRLESFAMQHPGDAKRGAKIFRSETQTKCVTCHRVDGKGGVVGPDLSKIGGKFDRIHLIESLLEPSRQIVEGYQTIKLRTLDGVVQSGVATEHASGRVTIVDQNAKSWDFQADEIDAMQPSAISTMPEGICDSLDEASFCDLVAYLETLRTGSPTGFGAGTRGPIQLADGFNIQTLATGLSGAVAMELLADGRILVAEQNGHVRVVKDGKLLDQPMLSLPVEFNWERGLIGLTVHPDFPAQPYLYVLYVTDQPFSNHVISRFRVDGDRCDPASEQILLAGDDQSKMGGFKPSGHQGGGMHFGPDGCLYVGLGEQTAKTPAQQMDTLPGKILRLNADGSIPTDNPFLGQTAGKYQSIWAIGCRNPFTFAFDSTSGMMLINDVGGKFEEINPGRPGANYGWPKMDHGPMSNPQQHSSSSAMFTGPIHWYPEASISGGDFAPATAGPLAGRYVFADFVHGWIRHIDPHASGSQQNHGMNQNLEPETLASGLRRPVDLRIDRQGNVFVLLRNAWVVDDKFAGGTGSLIRIGTDRQTK
ncbi:MAG: PQQ-dependent sugar dehydrogenase [Planctomycetota bacterium]